MQQEKYDIFISYRRKDENGKEWGTSIARNVLQGLEDRGYKGRVFFDHNKIGPEDFEKKILGAIKQAKVFLCILTKNAMDNCVNEGDWVRREICQAIESGLKIIFLNPDNEFNHNLLPDNFPKEIEIVKTQNSIEIRSGQKFEVDIDDMIKRYINEIVPCRIVSLPKLPASVPMGTLYIKTDLDCRVLNYEEKIGELKAGKYKSFLLPLGDNLLRFVCGESNEEVLVKKIRLENNLQMRIEINLGEKWRELVKKRKEVNELLNMPNADFEERKWLGKYGIWSKSLYKMVTQPIYDYIGLPFRDGLAQVSRKGKWGFVSKCGLEVISNYDNAYSFENGLAAVSKNGKWGFINCIGDVVIPLVYDEVGKGELGARRRVGLFEDGFANVKRNGRWGCIDKKGNEVIPCIYYEIGNFKEGLMRVSKGGKWGFVDARGNVVISLDYDYVYDFENGLALVKRNDKWGMVDKTGIEVITLIYDSLISFSEGLSSAKKGEKWGYINKDGKVVIPFIFDGVSKFSEGLAGVCRKGKWGYIDKRGFVIIPFIYGWVDDFRNGKADVSKFVLNFWQVWFSIDKNGNKVE